MTDTEDDPLERIVVDKDAVNRERLADAIEGVLGVDGDTGEVVPRPDYRDLENKPKFVARLLARRAAFELDIIEEDEIGDSATGFAERMEPSDSTIMNYGSLDFVANDDEHGGYYIKGHSISIAIDFLEDAMGDSDE
ncbi:hypothetical protein ACM16X_20990 [Haloarcula japonica]|uniref:hypothetical protein n=1 Tax=Haloarcula japonica TaxID=29282 RepID=UPI0039F699AB